MFWVSIIPRICKLLVYSSSHVVVPASRRILHTWLSLHQGARIFCGIFQLVYSRKLTLCMRFLSPHLCDRVFFASFKTYICAISFLHIRLSLCLCLCPRLCIYPFTCVFSYIHVHLCTSHVYVHLCTCYIRVLRFVSIYFSPSVCTVLHLDPFIRVCSMYLCKLCIFSCTRSSLRWSWPT